jgi:hypothetical protein
MSPGASVLLALGIVAQQLEGKEPEFESLPDVETQ